MRFSVHSMLAGLGAAALVSACTFVTVDPGAEHVRVVEAGHVADCERVGRTRVSVADRVGFINRSDEAIAGDLDVMARNSAADLGGDTVYRDTEVVEGRATYQVYTCG